MSFRHWVLGTFKGLSLRTLFVSESFTWKSQACHWLSTVLIGLTELHLAQGSILSVEFLLLL